MSKTNRNHFYIYLGDGKQVKASWTPPEGVPSTKLRFSSSDEDLTKEVPLTQAAIAEARASLLKEPAGKSKR